MKDLGKTERAILWYLLKRGRLASHVAVTGVEELRKNFELREIQDAWNRLSGVDLVQGVIGGGGFSGPAAYKEVRKMFWFRFFVHRFTSPLRRFFVLVWGHLLGKVVIGVLIAVLALIANSYVSRRLGLSRDNFVNYPAVSPTTSVSPTSILVKKCLEPLPHNEIAWPATRVQSYGDSPDGRFYGMQISTEGGVTTYLVNAQGQRVTGWCEGSLMGWSPDSTRAMLFVPAGDRRIYYLEPDGDFYDSGLPAGSTSADISRDGQVVYTVTERGTDRSSMYVRDSGGADHLIVPGEGMIMAWVRWSPTGNKVGFLKADLGLSAASRELWVVDADGVNPRQLTARVDWGKPPAWSADGTKLMISVSGKTQAYSVQ